MQQEVLIRRPLASGDKQLIRANVITERGEELRVQIQGQKGITVVQKKDVVPSTRMFGTRQGQKSMITKQHPQSMRALTNML